MSDLVNALQSQNRSSSVLGAIANPATVNPLAAIGAGTQLAGNILDLRSKQADQAWGQALQQATDPTTGVVDFNKAQGLAAQNPAATMGMARNLQNTSNIRGQQIEQASGLYNLVGRMSASVMSDPSDQNVAAIRAQAVNSGLPSSAIAEIDRIAALPAAQRPAEALNHNLGALDGLTRLQTATGGAPLQINQGGAITGAKQSPITGAITPSGAPVPMTQTPENLNQIVQIGTNQDGSKRMGTQRQAQNLAAGRDANDDGPTGTPGTPGTPGTGAGAPAVVRDSSGQPVSRANPPRLNVPGQPNAPPPAPPGAATGVPATGGNVGFGAAVGGAPAASGAALPPPPIPPANVPPSPVPAANSTAPVWNPNNPVGTSAVTPATANPAIASAQAQAKASGQPVPIPGIPGMVAKPDGSVGPPGGTGFPRPTLPPNAPTASLQGGVPVASTNALAPNLGAPSAPSPLVPGDVNAIMAGINRTRGTPVQGTQTAANTSAPGFTVGLPTAQESALTATGTASAGQFQNIVQQGVKARSQDALLATMLSEAQGFRPGPGADLASTVKRTILGLGAQFGTTFGVDTDKLAKQESVQKIANQLADAQGAGSDARLAVSEGANPSVHNTPAGLDLIIRQLRGNADYLRVRQQLAAQYPDKGDIEGFESKVGADLDPRVFQYQRLNPQQRTDYYTGLTDKSTFRNAYDWANGKGLLAAQATP